MKNNNLIRRVSAFMCALVLVGAGAVGFFTSPVEAIDSSYGTDSFNVHVVANENNSFDVQENIRVDFYYPHHGIYRYVPTNGVKISNIRIPDHESDVYKQDGNVVMQIGSGDYTVNGKQLYRIGYRMTAYDDQEKDLDRLMLNVIPTGWETPIQHASATIELPKKADLSNIQIYSGPAWSEENRVEATATGSADGKTITVDAYNLDPGDGITIIVELPEGYWVGERVAGAVSPGTAFLMILGPIMAAVLWFMVGRDKHMVKTIEFYPPKGLTPGEIGYIVDNNADKRDVISTIVYMANKGYLSIEEYGDTNDYLFRKLHNINVNEPAYIKDIFHGLFGTRNKVVSSNLGEEFGRKYEESLEDLNNMFLSERKSIYTASSKSARGICMVLASLPCYAYMTWEAYSGYDTGFFMNSICAIIACYLICNAVDRIHSAKKTKTALKVVGAALLIELGLGTTMGSSELLMMLGDSKALTVRLIVYAAEAVIMFFAVIVLARKPAYTDLMGKILGFRDFIKTAELDKLKTLVEENPTYFYDVMPYAYVFGLSDKWIKNFENFELPRPEWYAGSRYDFFDGYMMGRMMSSCNAGVSSHIRIPVDTSGSGVSSSGWFSGGSGGGFSGGGGGFSGGGFGGGGGGSW